MHLSPRPQTWRDGPGPGGETRLTASTGVPDTVAVPSVSTVLAFALASAVVVAIPVAVLFYFQFRSLDDIEETSAVVLRQLSRDSAESLAREIEETLKRPQKRNVVVDHAHDRHSNALIHPRDAHVRSSR